MFNSICHDFSDTLKNGVVIRNRSKIITRKKIGIFGHKCYRSAIQHFEKHIGLKEVFKSFNDIPSYNALSFLKKRIHHTHLTLGLHS